MRVLVVGANGQLGARCCTGLARRGHQVRGSVRDLGRAGGLVGAGVDVVEADLTDPNSFVPALDGVEVVLLTANAVAPRKGDRPHEADDGLFSVVDLAERSGVRRVVLTSLPETPVDAGVPLADSRRRLERRLAEAALEDVVLRFPPFMEAWLALVGSSIPLRGEDHATLSRPSPSLRAFRRLTGSLVEDRGLMLVPGSPDRRNSFIALDDVTQALCLGVERPDLSGRTVEVGGPEVLTWRDVAATYARLLGRRVRILSTPAAVYAAMAAALRPLSEVQGNTMALNRYVAMAETDWRPGAGLLDPAGMTTVEGFLRHKLDLPRDLPTVV
jgi:uncharacterized protein YbjT (DUF2867 family)